MHWKFYVLFSFLLFQLTSSAQSEDLRILSIDEILERIEKRDFHYAYAKFLNAKREPLTAYERTELNQGRMARHYYENAEGIVKEVIVKPYELEDKFNDIIIKTALSNVARNEELVAIDCDTVQKTFDYILLDEYDPFTSLNISFDSLFSNRELLDSIRSSRASTFDLSLSVLTHCEWQDHLKSIEDVLIDQSSSVAVTFYRKIEDFVERGLIQPKVFAEIQDKILVAGEFSQIYGTQLSRNRLRKLIDPFSVNKRRFEVGLGPIEDFLYEHGLDFDIEVERMRRGL